MGKISIVGLGPGDYSQISQGTLEILQSSSNIFLRTEKHPTIDVLKESIQYTSLDHFYDNGKDFEEVYYKISEFIIESSKKGDVVYAVPGHPRVAEKTVRIIETMANEKDIEVETIASMSFIDAMFNYLGIDPAEGFKLLDAFEIQNSYVDTNTNMIITQVYDHFIASNLKLTLLEYYDYDQEVCIVTGAGVKNLESKTYIPLHELDRMENEFNYLSSLYIPKTDKKMYNTINELQEIMDTLRGPSGCDWDKKQTHESLKKYVIEESYELCQAIDNDDIDEIIEELGDILLQVIFHCQIGQEEGYFDLKEVINGICTKLIHRHPHVFNEQDLDMNDFEKTWEDLKQEEKGESSITEGLKRIPKYLPSLIRAEKIQNKAALVGFDWDNVDDVFKKIEEEYQELLDEHKVGNIKYIKEELGDLLFSIVNLARFLNINPEEALNCTNQKFINRFEFMEDYSKSLDRDFKKMSLEEKDELWKKAKVNKL